MSKHDDTYNKNFTRIPNIVFVSPRYEHLTKEELFLYCKLRSIFWDTRPHFHGLRDLSEVTRYSRSALGKMLPHLNDCGLIHAQVEYEVKDGIKKGNPKYRISIPDIWEENRKYFEICPPNEPSLNEPVHETSQACPPNKPGSYTKQAKLGSFHGQDDTIQANAEARSQLPKDNKDNKDIVKKATDVANPPTNLSSFSDQERIAYHAEEIRKIEEKNLEHLFTSDVEKPASDASPIANESTKPVEPEATRKAPSKPSIRVTRQRNTEPLQKPLPKLEEPKFETEKARTVWEEWSGMPYHGGIKLRLTTISRDHCETLSLADEPITRDVIFKVRRFAEARDTNLRGWELGNMVAWYPKWRTAQYQAPAKQEAPKLNRPKTIEEMDGLERAKYWEQKYAKKPAVVMAEERKQS